MAARTPPATPPETDDLRELQPAAAGCTACDLAGPATQTVFGEGTAGARVVFVGEQPGDQEDRIGRPFVGPAGRVLDQALVDAGIDRDTAYVTNAVKHFRFERARGGSMRLHKSPTVTQVRICRPWLDAELRAIDPDVVVALGAVAAKALRGQDFRITASRGQVLDHDGRAFVATAHPSAVLRADDREAAYDGLVADLRVVASVLSGSGGA